uniref:Uncharacterized protein n=1 Tax=Rhizophora mucronata TaxID=61149 RepID=A0A2P2PKD1_RHIMU
MRVYLNTIIYWMLPPAFQMFPCMGDSHLPYKGYSDNIFIDGP